MERTRAEERRLHTEVSSVRTQSTCKSGDDYRSEEKAAIRAIPPDVFYDRPPRLNQLNPEPLTLSDLRTMQTDSTGRKESRRHSSQMSCLTPSSAMHQSSRFGTLTDIEAFERYCKDLLIFQYPNDDAWRALRNVFPILTMDALYAYHQRLSSV